MLKNASSATRTSSWMSFTNIRQWVTVILTSAKNVQRKMFKKGITIQKRDNEYGLMKGKGLTTQSGRKRFRSINAIADLMTLISYTSDRKQLTQSGLERLVENPVKFVQNQTHKPTTLFTNEVTPSILNGFVLSTTAKNTDRKLAEAF